MKYLLMLIAGIFGILIHILVKVKAMNSRLDQETYKTIWKSYWNNDFVSVILSFVTVLFFIFIYDELPSFQKNDDSDGLQNASGLLLVLKFLTSPKTAFALIGYCANSVVDTFFGGTEKKLKAKEQAQ